MSIIKTSKPRFKILTIIIIGCLITSFLGYVVYNWLHTETTDNAYIEAEISNVSAEISGVISEIMVEENVAVKKDQVIAKINDKDYAANFEKAKIALEAGQRNIEIIEKNINLARIESAKAQETLEFTEANLKFAKVDFNRTKALSKDNFASKQKLDASEIALERAKNEFDQARLNVLTSNEKLALLDVERLAAIANQDKIKQEVILAQRALDNTCLKAPIDGIFGNSALKIGTYVRAGSPLFAIVPEKLYIKANFKETQVSKFVPGMKATVEFDSKPGYKITGYIRNIAPATGAKFSLLPPANATGNFTKIVQRIPVFIDFQIPEELHGRLTPGMSSLVSVRID